MCVYRIIVIRSGTITTTSLYYENNVRMFDQKICVTETHFVFKSTGNKGKLIIIRLLFLFVFFLSKHFEFRNLHKKIILL